MVYINALISCLCTCGLAADCLMGLVNSKFIANKKKSRLFVRDVFEMETDTQTSC